MTYDRLNNFTMLAGRAMLAAIFIVAGLDKIGGYAGTQAYMESAGIPGILLPAVIALEVAGGIAILVGFRTRILAALLAAFTLIAAIVFHSEFSQPMQSILFMKNIAIAGAFLLLISQGPGEWAFDHRQTLREIQQ